MPLSIYMCSYPRGKDATGRALPPHWSFFVMTNATTTDGIEYQIRGSAGAFYFSGAEKAKLNKSSTTMNRTHLEIGTIPTDTLDAFGELLSTVAVNNNAGAAWTSQDWSLAAIKELFQRQWIWYDGATIKTYLEEESAKR